MKLWVIVRDGEDRVETVLAEEVKVEGNVATFYEFDNRPGVGVCSWPTLVSAVYVLSEGMHIRESLKGATFSKEETDG